MSVCFPSCARYIPRLTSGTHDSNRRCGVVRGFRLRRRPRPAASSASPANGEAWRAFIALEERYICMAAVACSQLGYRADLLALARWLLAVFKACAHVDLSDTQAPVQAL
jgi:hypothetical protein